MSSKRHSILPAIDRSGPKPPVSFSSSLTISDNAILQGTHSITMQSETVVHPRAKFESHLGSILIGRRCIIHERAHIGARPGDIAAAKPGGVVFGDYVVVEVGSRVEAGDTEIGEGTTVQVGSRIGSGAKIGKHCTISHMSTIPPGEVVPDFTTVYSNGLRRTDRRGVCELRKHGLVKQITVLKKMIPSNPEKFK
ncbi:bacterial transferase hexapeptide (six repeats) domain-containing protein [Hirsutella rhossiliensis]|uniref:Dynactin subunit 6 n=1 Tax=Hirsutella rhossiliensis TaxID=111463 RepID=A0A9P8MR14_9HYPO|nr:bacterial transferase hexapeptide (six repeats) domain-containing protein [Hirsutella rhossiliensis]KAH0958601.1 bacterial transferase hexapeptide (six repeats) domain-containing protein [Hirsutella rhossiliensis]